MPVPNPKAREQRKRTTPPRGTRPSGTCAGGNVSKTPIQKEQLNYFSSKLLRQKSLSRKIGQKGTNKKAAGRTTSAFNYPI
jgi:hypothetical protein